MSTGDAVPSSWSTPTRNCWALPSLQVELLRPGWDRADLCCEMVTEDHWQLVLVLEGELKECVTNDYGLHLHCRVGEGECSLRYFPWGVKLKDVSEGGGGSRLLIRFASLELFGPGRFRREADELRLRGTATALTLPVSGQMLRTAAEIRAHSVRPQETLPILAGALELLRQIAVSRELSRAPGADREKSAIDAACRILESRLDDPPTLEELATQVGMSATRFKQAFSRVRGVPPFTYLRNLRLERAMCLLRHEGLRVTEAALEVGYNNFSHFTKIFEARFGLVPSRVRQETTSRLAALVFGLHAVAAAGVLL